MANRHSKQYEWFRGTNPETNKKDFKKQIKIFWKFFKIFLYISLFVFTMFGCVQIFTHKISNNVGQGVEFYVSESAVAPHVTTFDIDKRTNEAITIYKNSKTNTWVNKKEQDHLDEIHRVIATQDKKGKLKLQSAIKGVNEGFRFNFLSGVDVDKFKVASDGINKVHTKNVEGHTTPIVGSSKMEKYGNIEGTQKSKNNIVMYVYQTNKKLEPKDKDKMSWQKIDFKLEANSPQEKFRLDIFDAFFEVPFIKDFFAKNPIDKKKDVAYRTSYMASWKTIADYVKITKVIDDKGKTISWEFHKNDSEFIPMEAEGSTYIPMVTWKDAWVRGVGPFYGIFVYPIAMIASKIANALPFLSGWETFLTIVFTVFLIRAITFLLSFKGTMQQTKMQEMQAKKAIIDAKYAPYKGNKQMENRQKQEVVDLYKKGGISPLSSLGTIFLTMPFFLAIWRVIGSIPHIKSTIWLGMNFSATSYKEVLAGEFQYLPLIVLAALFAAAQQMFPKLLTKRRDKNKINVHQKQAMKKNNRIQMIMMVVFVVMSIIFQAGLQVYWIVGGIWMIFQSLITHNLLIRQSKNRKHKRI